MAEFISAHGGESNDCIVLIYHKAVDLVRFDLFLPSWSNRIRGNGNSSWGKTCAPPELAQAPVSDEVHHDILVDALEA